MFPKPAGDSTQVERASPSRPSASATAPPSELPAACAPASPSPSRNSATAPASASTVGGPASSADVPEAGQVERHHLALARHAVEHGLPHLPLGADAVDEHERRAAAAADVCERHVAEA